VKGFGVTLTSPAWQYNIEDKKVLCSSNILRLRYFRDLEKGTIVTQGAWRQTARVFGSEKVTREFMER
jgi:hypothetical protein